MQKGRLLIIVDDARISRFICNVAQRLELACRSVKTDGDLVNACDLSEPHVILLGPCQRTTKASNVLHKLAIQHTDAAIVLAGNNSKHIHYLEGIGDSLGLNMAGALPDVVDVATLKRALASIFQSLGTLPTELRNRGGECEL